MSLDIRCRCWAPAKYGHDDASCDLGLPPRTEPLPVDPPIVPYETVAELLAALDAPEPLDEPA